MNTHPDLDFDIELALTTALDGAREVAALLRKGFQQEIRTEQKEGIELVTEYDRRSEEVLIGRVRDAFPDHRVVGEETGVSGTSEKGQPTWYIDPLDGTVNFAHHIPWYAVSIGLELHGRGLVGVVVAPEMGWELTAKLGGGTRLNGKAVTVSRTSELPQALLATGFPYKREDFDNVDFLREALASARGIRRMGTASLDCLAVACGWLDGYWEFRLRPWDVSAGALLVREAGGVVTGVDGRPFDSNHGEVLATNGAIHQQLIDLLVNLPAPPERNP